MCEVQKLSKLVTQIYIKSLHHILSHCILMTNLSILTGNTCQTIKLNMIENEE